MSRVDTGRLDRRTLLRGGLLGGAGAVVVAGGLAASAAPADTGSLAAGAAAPGSAGAAGDLVEPFHGTYQAGILTPPQPYATFVALDLVGGAGAEEMGRLMRVWTDDISRLTAGRAPVTDQEPELAERVSGLTVTVGWGSGAFVKTGLEERRPSWLRPIPPLPIDELDDAWGGG